MAKGVIWATGAAALALIGCGSDERSVDNADSTPSVGSAMAATPAAKTGPGSWKLPMKASAIPATEYAAIMKAAGFKKFGKVWAESADYVSGYKVCANIAEGTEYPSIRDINGDGKPEVIIQNACGAPAAGQYYTIVSWTGTVWSNVGDIFSVEPPIFTPRKGSAWADISTTSFPGFCQGVTKWGGLEYNDFSKDLYWDGELEKCVSPKQEALPASAKTVAAANGTQGKLPIPVGYYAVNSNCAEALKNRDGTTITETEYLDIVDRIPVKVTALGGDRYSLGPELFSMRVTGAKTFTTDDGMEYTWCAAKAPK